MTEEHLNLSDYESGTILFSGPDDEEAILQAKCYIKDKNIDKQLIKLVRYTAILENGVEAKIIAVVVK